MWCAVSSSIHPVTTNPPQVCKTLFLILFLKKYAKIQRHLFARWNFKVAGLMKQKTLWDLKWFLIL